jgi:hypothetical protein
MDDYEGSILNVNMRGQSQYVLSNAGITSLRVIYSKTISRDVAAGAGWNMIGPFETDVATIASPAVLQGSSSQITSATMGGTRRRVH